MASYSDEESWQGRKIGTNCFHGYFRHSEKKKLRRTLSHLYSTHNLLRTFWKFLILNIYLYR
jgi:hypothetical protein